MESLLLNYLFLSTWLLLSNPMCLRMIPNSSQINKKLTRYNQKSYFLGSHIPDSPKQKHFVVLNSSDMKCTSHVTMLVQKFNQLSYMAPQTFQNISQVLVSIYKSFIRSILNNALLVRKSIITMMFLH